MSATITNETIINAAKAAGLEVTESPDGILWRHEKGVIALFTPKLHDTDNAMIRRGAEIDVIWDSLKVVAFAWTVKNNALRPLPIEVEYGDDKAQAERKAVILCAAAKWDAMNGEKA